MAPSVAPLEVEQTSIPNGDEQVAVVKKGSLKSTEHKFDAQHEYVIPEKPLGSRRPIRVVCVGAGYSGIMTAITVHEKMQDLNVDLVVYEREEDLGGTWLVNKYPGCKCDIPAHNYAYSFHPNPKWRAYYATRDDIHAYLQEVGKHYELNKYIKYQHAVSGATWNELKGKWDMKIKSNGSEFSDECDVLIDASGVLSSWKWPDIKGLHSFKGKLMHSAVWDKTYDFTDKKVGVIGIGSSGIQIVPQLAKVVKHLDHHVRTPVWVSPAPGINEPTDKDPEMDENYVFSEKTMKDFSDPETLREYRRAIIDRKIDDFKRTTANHELQFKAQDMFRKSMKERLGNTEKGKRIADLLLPDFPVGCRRDTPGPGFLEALGQDNVDLKWDDIGEITEKGMKSKNTGEEYEYDVIVCATGFDTTFKPSFPLVGRDGNDLRKRWDQDLPKAYFGICVPNLPNYFSFVGPNSPVTNGSLILGIQITAIYIYKWLEKLQTEDIKSFCVREDVNEEYNEHMQQYLQRTVWVGGCRSWYKRGTKDGPVTGVYGGTSFHHMEALKNPRWEDFDMDRVDEAKFNRFAYLGNGFTMAESVRGSVAATQTLNFDEYFNLFVPPRIHG